MSIINLKATSPSGKIYIGDPCYVMKRDLYDKLFDKMNWNVPGGCSIETEVLPGVFACAGTTKHGDGWYETGSVDSGTIGAVPIEACDQDKLFPKKEPGKFSFPEYMIWDTNEVNLEYGTDSCQFFFYSDFDNIVVDTNEGAYEDYEDEELDEAVEEKRSLRRFRENNFVKSEYYDDNNKKIKLTLKDNESVLEFKLGSQVFEFKKSQLFSFLLDLKNAFNTMKDW